MGQRDESILAGLNPGQKTAANLTQHTLILAPPGSGKTQTMAAMGAYLLSDGVSQVAAMTFTREGAKELRTRTLSKVAPGAEPRFYASTFASFFYSLIQPRSKPDRFGHLVMGKRAPRKPVKLVEDGARYDFINRAGQMAGVTGRTLELASEIEKVKAGIASGRLTEPTDLYNAYQALLLQNNCIDLSDAAIFAAKGLMDGSIALLNAHYLLVDEAQDNDFFQWGAILAHAQRNSIVAVVGDDDQAIYAWREATGYKGMMNFVSTTGAKIVTLDTNYRSNREIVDHGVILMHPHPNRVKKKVIAHKGEGGEAWTRTFNGDTAEYRSFSFWAEQIIKEEQTGAAIARNNADLDAFEGELRRSGIPFTRLGGKSILDRPDVYVLLDVLRALASGKPPRNDSALAWAGLSNADISKVRAIDAGLKGLTREALLQAGVSDAGASQYGLLAKKFGQWAGLKNGGRFTLLVSGVVEWLCDCKPKGTLSQTILCSIFTPPAGVNYEHFLRRFDKTDRKKESSEPIVLTTAHSSKGLEFDYVWITQATDDNWPGDKAGDELAEERRLFFVAMTRARQSLTVSVVGNSSISRFVREAGIQERPA
jgi:superfamily I DNA/RNA helicase